MIMENFFKLKELGTDTRTELRAGLTTFLAMAYILAVNPNILSASGMDSGAIFTATAVSAAFATLIMALYANYPIVLASGMGLNAYFAYSVCATLGAQGVNDPFKVALAAVLCEGIVFILLSFTNFREKLVNDIPTNLKYGITTGIGLFIMIVGLEGAGIVVIDESTVVTMGNVGSPQFILAMVGLIIIAVMYHYNVGGAILYGILITWGLGMIAQVTGWYAVDPENGVYSLFPDFSHGIHIEKMNMFAFDFHWISHNIMDFIVIIFSFLFVDIFDTVGTLIGVASKGNLLDDEGKLPRAKQALLADALGTVAGACMGTSTVTSYVESSAGVSAGGRTGLTALTSAVLFLLALFLSPIFLAIPSFATTPALIWVGFLMFSSVTKMDFEGDIADVVSGFMAVTIMPFTYSIANGIMFGMLSWVLLKVFTGKIKDVSAIMWICFVLFAFRIATLI